MYYSKKSYVSNLFYFNIKYSLSLEDCISDIANRDLDFYEHIEITEENKNKYFQQHVNRYKHEDIYFSDELKKIIFDDDGRIRDIDETIYSSIKSCADKFYKIHMDASTAMLENADKIYNGNYSEEVKDLLSLPLSGSEVTFEIKKPYIIAHFGPAIYHRPLIFKFHAIFDENLKIFDCEIVEQRILLNPDDTFQYDALVKTNNKKLEEIHIQFYNVEIEKTDCNLSKGIYNFLNTLHKNNISFVELTPQEVKSYKQEWFNRIVPADKHEQALNCNCFSTEDYFGYLWHVFSFEVLECFNGYEATIHFNNTDKNSVVLLLNSDNMAYKIEDASKLIADDFKPLYDITLTDIDFKWTYTKTHEPDCGPYYYVLT